MWLLPNTVEFWCVKTTQPPNAVDVIGLQHQDLNLKNLVQKKTYRDWSVWQKPSDLIFARKGEETPVWVVLAAIRIDLIALAHKGGHPEIVTAIVRVEASVQWPSICKNVANVINNSLPCTYNPERSVNKGPLSHQRTEKLWTRLQIDLIGPLPKTPRGNKNCLVIIDSFTKWIEAIPTKTCTTTATATHILIDQVFAQWGTSKCIDSD